MGMFGTSFDSSKKESQQASGCCSLELEEVSDKEAEATSKQPSGSDGGCCGGTGQKEPASVASHA